MRANRCVVIVICLCLAGCNRPKSTADLHVIANDWQAGEIKTCYETIHDGNVELAGDSKANSFPNRVLYRVLICGADMQVAWDLGAADMRAALALIKQARHYDRLSAIAGAKVYPVRFFAKKSEPPVDPKYVTDNPSWSCQRTAEGIDCK